MTSKPEMKVTDFQRLQDSLEKQTDCPCGRGQKVMYFCSIEDCVNHLTLPLYCMLCSDDEDTKHNHRPKLIAIKGDTAKSDWQQLR